MIEHFDLTGKHACVIGATPAADAIAAAYAEAGAQVSRGPAASAVSAPLDVLACAPDVFAARPLEDVDDAELHAVMQANFGVQYAAARAARPLLGDGGRIVLVTTVLGERGLPNCTAYAAAQGAVHNFIRAAAQELAPHGICINGIELGWMEWMDDRLDPRDPEAARAVRFTIAKRAGRPADVGPLAVWLSGSGAGFVTGQVFPLDGGLTQHL